MQTKRTDAEHMTEIVVWFDSDAPQWGAAHSITCMAVDISIDGERQPPTARFSLLTPHSRATIADLRRIAHEYAQVADVAAELQAEKRAAYHARFGED